MLITTIIIFPYAAFAVIAYSSHAVFSPLEGIPSLFINIMTNEAVVAIESSTIGKSILLCLIGILIYIARLSLCIPVAFIVRNPVAVMTVGIVSAFGFDLLAKAMEDAPVLGSLLSYTPYAVIYDLNMDVGADIIVKAIISSIIFIFLMTVLTYTFFRKSEIK